MAAQDAVAVLERVRIPLASHDKKDKSPYRAFIFFILISFLQA